MRQTGSWHEALTSTRQFACPLVIGVLSDTHMFRRGSRILPAEVPALFERAGTDLLLHAGDMNDERVLLELAHVAPVIAVTGNNDVAALRERVGMRESLQAGPHKIGLIHGHGGRSAREVAFESFDDSYDLVVYGHSHIPKIERRGGTIFFNPGSPTDRRWGPHFGVGLLRCSNDALEPELVLFSRAADLNSVIPRREP